jgi:hypothetical protein
VLHSTIYGIRNLPASSAPSFTFRYYAPEATEHTSEHPDRVMSQQPAIVQFMQSESW